MRNKLKHLMTGFSDPVNKSNQDLVQVSLERRKQPRQGWWQYVEKTTDEAIGHRSNNAYQPMHVTSFTDQRKAFAVQSG